MAGDILASILQCVSRIAYVRFAPIVLKKSAAELFGMVRRVRRA
jgi:hypothetical protein